MRSQDDRKIPVRRKATRGARGAREGVLKITQSLPAPTVTVDTAIWLLGNIVETACDHEPNLDLMRLTTLVDLYRVYLQEAIEPDSSLRQYQNTGKPCYDSILVQGVDHKGLVSFECFVRNSGLLSLAAQAASVEAGETVLTPASLLASANN